MKPFCELKGLSLGLIISSLNEPTKDTRNLFKQFLQVRHFGFIKVSTDRDANVVRTCTLCKPSADSPASLRSLNNRLDGTSVIPVITIGHQSNPIAISRGDIQPSGKFLGKREPADPRIQSMGSFLRP